jgi:hypothetical protein
MSPAHDERDRIRGAMRRILDGNPEHSNGALTVVALAIEAQALCNVLTQRHPDLRNGFYDHVRERGAVPDTETRLRARIVQLKGDHRQQERGVRLTARGRARACPGAQPTCYGDKTLRLQLLTPNGSRSGPRREDIRDLNPPAGLLPLPRGGNRGCVSVAAPGRQSVQAVLGSGEERFCSRCGVQTDYSFTHSVRAASFGQVHYSR